MVEFILICALLLAALGGLVLAPLLKAQGGRPMAAGIALMLLSGAAALYLLVGSPTLIGKAAPNITEMKQAQTAVAKAPGDAAAWDRLAALYRENGYPNEALRATEAGLRITPTAPRYGDLAEALLMQAGADAPIPEAAIKAIENGLVLDDTDPRLRFLSARIKALTGETDAATALLTALARDEDAPTLWRNRAFAAIPDSAGPMLPDPDRIRSMVEGLSARLTADGGTAEEWARLANALGVLGETDRAIAAWQQVAALDSSNPVPLLSQARLLRSALNGQPDTPEILALLEDAQARDPSNFEAGWLLALAKAQAGEIEAARNQFNAMLNTLPADDSNRAELEKLRDAALATAAAGTPE